MLFQERPPEPGLPSHCTYTRFLNSSDYPKERSLAASVSAEDGPTVALRNRECHILKDLGRTELHSNIRNGNLSQLRSTLPHAVRQRSNVSSVWSPMWPIRKVELF